MICWGCTSLGSLLSWFIYVKGTTRGEYILTESKFGAKTRGVYFSLFLVLISRTCTNMERHDCLKDNVIDSCCACSILCRWIVILCCLHIIMICASSILCRWIVILCFHHIMMSCIGSILCRWVVILCWHHVMMSCACSILYRWIVRLCCLYIMLSCAFSISCRWVVVLCFQMILSY